MTRAVSSSHLGGIGLMLEVARICPRCGKHLSDSPLATTYHLARGDCRPVVFAALPDAKPLIPDDDPPLPAARQIHDFEAPAARTRRVSPLAAAGPIPSFEGPGRALAIPWLRPPDLGEVL